ncbi:protein-L-isoaspartate(D-aspartate) O-methyltransferase [Saccharothrix deserti]|uniref:protein-L-isoaspartate(D-aspartate) O-methyltransferase n=1 Tax=Saccharothrix deserti TaxID=2593674 RepID=UPI001EE3EB88|nr:protein-L-isoaspartate(D-aspartate) O-methyltransferase [Saccharothrix deserti]
MEDLVRTVRARSGCDGRVLDAIRRTARAEFLPEDEVASANYDTPLPIGHGQVATQPSLSATMLDALALTGTEHVLEIGTGSGFQTALLARLAGDVVSVELWADLTRQAGGNLARLGIGNVELRVGDGTRGVPEHAPYDAVVVSAAFPEVPAPLVEQLRVGGRLVQPIGPGGGEEVVLFVRVAGGLERRRVLTSARFVRLYGDYGYPR